ncbi:hypothetical protein KR084_002135, partial [Drosophila pseudotakahashii]
MALVAHRMMLPARHRRNTTQQVARNKVGVLLVPSVADYYGGEMPPLAAPSPTPAASQLHLPQDPTETAAADGSNAKVSATSRCNGPYSVGIACESKEKGISSGDFHQKAASLSPFSLSLDLCFFFVFCFDWRQLYFAQCALRFGGI